MRIGIVTEVSTKEKNAFVVAGLEKRGHEVHNLGMKGVEGEPELSYINTGFLAGVLLGSGSVDLVVGGCGTGQGFLNSAMQYPGVSCGLIETPLDAWLFVQINGGNCVSLVLNKGFGWAGDVNIRFIFDRFFSVERGYGYPEHRKAPQQRARVILGEVSAATHRPLPEIVQGIDDVVARPALTFPGVMEFLRMSTKSDNPVRAACERRFASR